MFLEAILLIVLVMLLLGGFHEHLGYSSGWGGGALGSLVVVLLVWVLMRWL